MHYSTLQNAALLLAVRQAAAQILYASSYDGKVTTLNLTSANAGGSPQPIKSVAVSTVCGDNPSWLRLDHANAILYCADEGFDTGGGLSALRAADDGSLTELARVATKASPVSAVLFGEHGLAMAH